MDRVIAATVSLPPKFVEALRYDTIPGVTGQYRPLDFALSGFGDASNSQFCDLGLMDRVVRATVCLPQKILVALRSNTIPGVTGQYWALGVAFSGFGDASYSQFCDLGFIYRMIVATVGMPRKVLEVLKSNTIPGVTGHDWALGTVLSTSSRV